MTLRGRRNHRDSERVLGGKGEQVRTGVLGSEAALNDNVLVDTRGCPFVKTHRTEPHKEIA